MIRSAFLFLLAGTVQTALPAQSTAFILNIGPSIGIQKWDNSFDREPLFKYHASLGIESVNNEDDRGALFAQVGYHVKGSANRFSFWRISGGGVEIFTENFLFNNISLLLGAKQKKPLGNAAAKYFYFGGIRGDYTLNTNLKKLNEENPFLRTYYPQDGFVRKWNAGVSVGGGLELGFSELIGAQVMLSVNPDLTNQYFQPPIPNVIDPFTPGQTITIPERRIRNTTIELSLGLRLLRKVEYVD
jgi:hypothetical protein